MGTGVIQKAQDRCADTSFGKQSTQTTKSSQVKTNSGGRGRLGVESPGCEALLGACSQPLIWHYLWLWPPIRGSVSHPRHQWRQVESVSVEFGSSAWTSSSGTPLEAAGFIGAAAQGDDVQIKTAGSGTLDTAVTPAAAHFFTSSFAIGQPNVLLISL